MRISDWSSDVCSSDLIAFLEQGARRFDAAREAVTLRDLAGRTKAELAQHRARRRIVDEMTRRQLGKVRSEEHTSELQSLRRTADAVLGLKKKTVSKKDRNNRTNTKVVSRKNLDT